MSLRQQIVIIIIILHRCRPLLLTKHGCPHDCFMALVHAVLLFPLYSRGHRASGRSPGQGTELELGLKPFALLNLCGLVNAACLIWGGRRRGSTRDWGPYPASSRRLLLAACQLEVRDGLPWQVSAGRPGVDPLGRRGQLHCCTSRHTACLPRFHMCIQLFCPESLGTSWCL